jgi:hypothetical protein
MNAQPSLSHNVGDASSLSITDLILQKPVWKEHVFPKLAAVGEGTVVSMNEDVDCAPFASVSAGLCLSLRRFPSAASVFVHLSVSQCAGKCTNKPCTGHTSNLPSTARPMTILRKAKMSARPHYDSANRPPRLIHSHFHAQI